MRSILVVTDLSSSEMDTAVKRAVHLARTHGASLKLMYLPSDRSPLMADAHKLLAAAADRLASDWPLRAMPVAVVAANVRDVAREAVGSDLIVFPNRRERSVAAFFLGQPIQRLAGMSTRPVLLARTMPRAPFYGRILVGVDFTERSGTLVSYAAGLGPVAGIELLHAVDRRGESYLRSAEVSDNAIRAYRASKFVDAQERIVRLANAFGARRNRVLTALRFGDAGRQIVAQQHDTRADLVVLGADRAAPIPLFVGGVAHRVLAEAGSDVLVIPRSYEPSTRWSAFGRLTHDLDQAEVAFDARSRGAYETPLTTN